MASAVGVVHRFHEAVDGIFLGIPVFLQEH